MHKHVPKPKTARKPRRGALAQQRPVDLGPAVVWGGAGAHAAAPMHNDDESAPSTPNSVMDMTDEREHNDSILPPPAVAAAAASAAAAAAGPPVPIPAAVELREQMKRKAAALLLPTSPLDELIDLLGGKDVVAEMTGRGARYIRTRSGRIELENRDAKGAGKDDVSGREEGGKDEMRSARARRNGEGSMHAHPSDRLFVFSLLIAALFALFSVDHGHQSDREELIHERR